MQPKPLHILISPLDWGLGHAARCIPLIQQLIQSGHEVTLAGEGRSLILLEKEFPFLKSIKLKGFSPSYPRSGRMILHLLLLLPQFISRTLSEHFQLKKLIALYHFDIVISDNRYGLWNKSIKSILITHQIMIKTPGWLRFAEYPVYAFSRMLINRFDECWIPDSKDSPGLSGDLSHKYPLPSNARFVGPLSRFEQAAASESPKPEHPHITVLISGPEPQRSIFEELLTAQLSRLPFNATLVGGKPESENAAIIRGNLTILPHLVSDKLNDLIASSSLIICRPGYSSIMDLHAMGAKALFVPTPGQTEQLYLAVLHQQSGIALWREQNKLNLETDIAEALQYNGFKKNVTVSADREAVTGLRKK